MNERRRRGRRRRSTGTATVTSTATATATTSFLLLQELMLLPLLRTRQGGVDVGALGILPIGGEPRACAEPQVFGFWGFPEVWGFRFRF